MLKNKELAEKAEAKICNWYLLKNNPKVSVHVIGLRKWVMEKGQLDYEAKVQSKFGEKTAKANDYLKKLDSISDFFHGEDLVDNGKVHEKIYWDFQIYAVATATDDTPLDIFLVHENPLTKEQIEGIKRTLDRGLEVIDDNIYRII